MARSSTGSPPPRECRDIDAAVEAIDGVTAAAVRDRAADGTCATVSVPDEYDRVVFELDGLDCGTCSALVEEALLAVDGVGHASATSHTGTVRVDYDGNVLTDTDLATRLDAVGYRVTSRDEAFENRRRAQWAGARIATGIMGGLMIAVPYIAVVYPTEFDALYDPIVLSLLHDALSSEAVFAFYLNLAVLSAVVLGFTGKPMFERGWRDLRSGIATTDLAASIVAVCLYGYSTIVAFGGFAGSVRYDLVVGLVVVVALTHHFELGVTTEDEMSVETDRKTPVVTDGGSTTDTSDH